MRELVAPIPQRSTVPVKASIDLIQTTIGQFLLLKVLILNTCKQSSIEGLDAHISTIFDDLVNVLRYSTVVPVCFLDHMDGFLNMTSPVHEPIYQLPYHASPVELLLHTASSLSSFLRIPQSSRLSPPYSKLPFSVQLMQSFWCACKGDEATISVFRSICLLICSWPS